MKRNTINSYDKNKFRIEQDSIGSYLVPKDALYGSQTYRSFNTFKITKRKIDHDFIKALVYFKKAAVTTNLKLKSIDPKIANAILNACNEIINHPGKYYKEFITDRIQGGAGTSMNMNTNEVIANLATLEFGGKLGEYIVHPNDHVNRGQSTNDVIPTAGKMALIIKTQRILKVIQKLKKALLKKGEEYQDILKLGRTHIQDAVPMTVGSFFDAWADSLARDQQRLEFAMQNLSIINAGSTAIGTGISQKKEYPLIIVEEMSHILGYKLKKADDLIDATRNTDAFVTLSSVLKIMAINLSKNCNDLRLLASGPLSGLGEFILPTIQPGSSIMPGKINPVIPEVVNQICFDVIGRDLTITLASEAGQLELNVFEPVIFYALFSSINYLKRGIHLLTEKAINGITLNRNRIEDNLQRSMAFATAFSTKYGYNKVSKIIKTAIKDDINIKMALKIGLSLSEEDYQDITNKKNVIPIKNNIKGK